MKSRKEANKQRKKAKEAKETKKVKQLSHEIVKICCSNLFIVN